MYQELGLQWIIVVGTSVVIIISIAFILNLVLNNRRLKRERDFASDIFNTAGSLILVLEKSGKIIRFNKSCGSTTGFKTKEVFGKNFLELISFDDSFIKTIGLKPENISLSDLPDNFEGFLKTKSQKNRVISWTKTSLINSGGYQENQILSGIDITDLKIAEEKLLEHQKELRSLNSELSVIEERERKRIAEDLHDRIAQTLALSKIQLAELQKQTLVKNITQPLNNLQSQIQKAINDTRNLIFELSPPILHQLGFEAAVEMLIDNFRKERYFEINYQNNHRLADLGNDLSVFLFKTLRELLNNAAKYSKASKVWVSLKRENEFITINVHDNGLGFEYTVNGTTFTKSGGFGLFNIKERLKHLDGNIEILSKPGKGTRVIIKVPVSKNK